MKIKFLDLQKINQSYEPEISQTIKKVIDSGWYILGNEVATFEKEFSDYIGTRFCIGVANGLDALTLIFRAYIELGFFSRKRRSYCSCKHLYSKRFINY